MVLILNQSMNVVDPEEELCPAHFRKEELGLGILGIPSLQEVSAGYIFITPGPDTPG